MLLWQLPLLSVILADPHQAVLTKIPVTKVSNVVTAVLTKIRQKRAVFDVLPTAVRQDRKCRSSKLEQKAKPSFESQKSDSQGKICSKDNVGKGWRVLKRLTTFMEKRRKDEATSRKAVKNILRRRFAFEKQALKQKLIKDHELQKTEAGKDMKRILSKKATKKKVSLVKDLILGGLTVLELFLRTG